MRILYCASEANPFCGSGGLADVAGSLPHTLCRKGQDCRIVVPLYGTIPQELKNSMNFITNFTVPVAWRHQYCGLFWARWYRNYRKKTDSFCPFRSRTRVCRY